MATAYDLAIRLSMTNNVSPGLALIAKEMLGLEMSAERLDKAFGKMGKGLMAAVGGAVALFGSYEIVKGLERVATAGEKLVHQQNVLYRATKDWNGVLAITGDAFERITKAVPTATASDVVRSYNELRSVMGSPERAKEVVPMSLRMEAVLENLTGKSAEGEGFKLWRALEMKGITADSSKSDLADATAAAMVRIIAGSGGKVDASIYQQLARRGGAAWIGATPEAIGPYSVMAADLGGDGAGTSLMTLRQLLTGATSISRQQLDVFQRAGLIDMSKVKKVPGSNSMQVEPGAIEGSLEGQNNIYAWAQQIAPKLHKLAGEIAQKDGLKESQVFDSLIAKIGRNRNAIKMLTMFTDPSFVDQINKDLQIWDQTMGLNEGYAAMLGKPDSSPHGLEDPMQAARRAQLEKADAASKGDYLATMKAMDAQWHSLLEAVGGPVARGAIPIIQGLTSALTTMAEFASNHPVMVENFAKGALAIAGVLAVVGTAAIAYAAFMIAGPVATGAAALASVMAVLAAINFDAVVVALKAFAAGIRAAIGAIQGAASMLPSIHIGEVNPGNALPSAAGRDWNAFKHLFQHNSYTTPGSPGSSGSTTIHASINVDGRQLAMATSEHISRLHDHSVSAPAFDMNRSYASADYNFATS